MAAITQTCINCQKQFLVIDQEQSFLQKKGLGLPKMCPSCRQNRRLALRGGRQLFKTACQKCAREIVVSFDPQKAQQPIFCKEDYDKYMNETDPVIQDPLPTVINDA